MALLSADAKAPAIMNGTGGVLVVDHTTDNNLMAFRMRNKDVKMLAAEDDFEMNGAQVPRRRLYHSRSRPVEAGAAD